jgi:hypothetical protein
MDNSIFLAKAVGLYLVILSVGMIFDAARFRPLILEIIDNPPLLFLSGFIALILGIVLVLSHNLWVMDWRVLITLVAWSALIKGIVRVVFPQMAIDLSRKWVKNDMPYYISGGLCLVLGIFLLYHGFMSGI